MPKQLLEKLETILATRLKLVTKDPRDRLRFERLWEKRIKEWKTRSPINWGDYKNHENVLIYPAGKHVKKKTRDTSWPTMTSMRTVDSECRIEINNPYLQEEEA